MVVDGVVDRFAHPPSVRRAALVRGCFSAADDVAIAAREVDRLVTVFPAHPVVLAAPLARHDLDDLALAAGLADLRALHDDPVTGLGVHGGTSFRACPLLSSIVLPRAVINARATA
jgi:hypothetical protein